ncbi:hypothetical protein JAAARDRAFT_28083 [Jaapia argillacea MUCL 33604]|uniref:Protein phosphatase inhibitor 2 (IPP-2) n=1 Tax=Jaapia argillacea MUCL 33604 TaxID=933084 RepID=A0A067QLT5_9AGAM|nr:hypothetical protein JAAARDRAFT_28083 [Jaapia argillacea MUCL 33604]
MTGTEVAQDLPHHPPLPRSASSHTKPKGILKNAPHPPALEQLATPPADPTGNRLQWDEENLAATEIQKDSLMKITEPKTPFVRYNAETDTIEGEIPNLDLYAGRSSTPTSPITTSSPANADSSGPSSRRESGSSAGGRPSISGRSSSRSSSRSTSFNLPSEAKGDIKHAHADRGGEVEEEEMDEEALAKHEAFIKARGRHYSNEAQAMKLAQTLMAEDDNDEEATPEGETDVRPDDASEDVSMEGSEAEQPAKPNGVLHRA